MSGNKAKSEGGVCTGLIIWIVIIIVIISVLGGADDNSNESATSVNEDTASANEAIPEENTVKEEPVITEISASYDGDTKEGTEINSESKTITVTATYSDGSTKVITDWSIDNPSALIAGQTSSYTISYGDLTTELDITCSTTDPSTYKEKCKNISYEELSRNPSQYEGELVTFTGKITQVMEADEINIPFFNGDDDKQNTYMIYVGYNNILEDYYDDMIACLYSPKDSSRLLEGDIVTLYGVYKGLSTYKRTVTKENVKIPQILAPYIDIE